MTQDELIAEIRDTARKIVAMCDHPEPGLFTWWGVLGDLLHDLCKHAPKQRGRGAL